MIIKLKIQGMSEDEEDVSYDVESLFPGVPVNVTIDFIIEEIYVRKLIEPMVESKLIFRRLLEKLTPGGIFTLNQA